MQTTGYFLLLYFFHWFLLDNIHQILPSKLFKQTEIVRPLVLYVYECPQQWKDWGSLCVRTVTGHKWMKGWSICNWIY